MNIPLVPLKYDVYNWWFPKSTGKRFCRSCMDERWEATLVRKPCHTSKKDFTGQGIGVKFGTGAKPVRAVPPAAPGRRAPLQNIHSSSPTQIVAMEIMGAFPPSRIRNTYILVVAHLFTNWIKAYAIPNQDTSTVVD